MGAHAWGDTQSKMDGECVTGTALVTTSLNHELRAVIVEQEASFDNHRLHNTHK